jgi:hypothetical protein
LVQLLNTKRPPINRFALQIDETPLYITYSESKRGNSWIYITEPGSTNKRVILINLNDSMTHFLFILSLIRDEYHKETLFTDKSEIQ